MSKERSKFKLAFQKNRRLSSIPKEFVFSSIPEKKASTVSQCNLPAWWKQRSSSFWGWAAPWCKSSMDVSIAARAGGRLMMSLSWGPQGGLRGTRGRSQGISMNLRLSPDPRPFLARPLTHLPPVASHLFASQQSGTRAKTKGFEG